VVKKNLPAPGYESTLSNIDKSNISHAAGRYTAKVFLKIKEATIENSAMLNKAPVKYPMTPKKNGIGDGGDPGIKL
jgi:hypothetical protein